MLALNVTVGGAIFFTLLAMFARQRQEALAALRVEQQKSENLLLNILPRSIADKLKAQTQPIADQFGSASILFARRCRHCCCRRRTTSPPFWRDGTPARRTGLLPG